MPDRVIEEGPWADARLQVEGQPGRVDWRIFSGTPVPDGPMVIGKRAEAEGPFLDLMSHWLDTSCPPVNRIAFGANLTLPEASLETISGQLDSMLPSVTVDPDGARDFVYRTNRRRQSTSAANLQVHRLATWSTMGSIGLEIAIGPGGGGGAADEGGLLLPPAARHQYSPRSTDHVSGQAARIFSGTH